MNKIVYAGSNPPADGEKTDSGRLASGKTLKIFVPNEEGKAVFDDGEYSFSRDRIIVIPPFVAHSLSPDKKTEGITVLIEQPLLNLKDAQILPDAPNDGIRRAAEQAEYFYSSGSLGKDGVLSALGGLFVSYVSLFLPKTSPVVDAVKTEINKNAVDSLYSVEATLRKIPLNYDYVRKLFKGETGLTPHEYLTAVRMERAAEIIISGVSNRYSSYTVGQIAEACGFAEPLYFSRVFKKYYGVSPTEYAKRR